MMFVFLFDTIEIGWFFSNSPNFIFRTFLYAINGNRINQTLTSIAFSAKSLWNCFLNKTSETVFDFEQSFHIE